MARRGSVGKIRTHNKGTPHGGHRLSFERPRPAPEPAKDGPQALMAFKSLIMKTGSKSGNRRFGNRRSGKRR